NGVQAEEILRAALKHAFSDRLVHHYGLVAGKDPARQLGTAEQWLSEHPHDATLLLALGRLALRNNLWGKAGTYLEASFSGNPDIQTCAELVCLLEHMGDDAASRLVQRKGFGLMMHDLPALPLPRLGTSTAD